MGAVERGDVREVVTTWRRLVRAQVQTDALRSARCPTTRSTCSYRPPRETRSTWSSRLLDNSRREALRGQEMGRGNRFGRGAPRTSVKRWTRPLLSCTPTLGRSRRRSAAAGGGHPCVARGDDLRVELPERQESGAVDAFEVSAGATEESRSCAPDGVGLRLYRQLECGCAEGNASQSAR